MVKFYKWLEILMKKKIEYSNMKWVSVFIYYLWCKIEIRNYIIINVYFIIIKKLVKCCW